MEDMIKEDLNLPGVINENDKLHWIGDYPVKSHTASLYKVYKQRILSPGKFCFPQPHLPYSFDFSNFSDFLQKIVKQENLKINKKQTFSMFFKEFSVLWIKFLIKY